MTKRNSTYQGYTLAEAQSELETWKEAKRAAATGKSYMLGSRMLTRYSLVEINDQIKYFAGVVDKLGNSTTSASGLTKVLARRRR